MTRLGYANPLYRLGRTVLGWLDPPQPGRHTPRDFCIIGHRGVASEAPENTIASFAKAIVLGADAIETDVCVTRDMHFVLWHDTDPDNLVALARQSGGEEYAYVPHVPVFGSLWRQPVHALDLATFQEHYGYTSNENGGGNLSREGTRPEVPVAGLEDLLAWVCLERRVHHIFLDIKLTPEQSDAAVPLLDRLRRLSTRAHTASGDCRGAGC
jgi:glycerophosphoryl diester phosphodiesterase